MTEKEAIYYLKEEFYYEYLGHDDYIEAILMAAKSIEQIKRIKDIISTPNTIIQEDVLKYKMICEVIENEGYN